MSDLIISFISTVRRRARPLRKTFPDGPEKLGPFDVGRQGVNARKQFPDKGRRLLIATRGWSSPVKTYVGQPSRRNVDVGISPSPCNDAILGIHGICKSSITCDQIYT